MIKRLRRARDIREAEERHVDLRLEQSNQVREILGIQASATISMALILSLR